MKNIFHIKLIVLNKGLIDELRIYEIALSTDQIAELEEKNQ